MYTKTATLTERESIIPYSLGFIWNMYQMPFEWTLSYRTLSLLKTTLASVLRTELI